LPVLESTYQPPFWAKNGHVSTIYTGLIRRVAIPQQKRERLLLADGDFLDLDWSYATVKADKLIILLHGLEGNAQRPYMTGTAKLCNDHGFDILAVNFRGCSGEPNRLFRSYHSGATEDLLAVVEHAVAKRQYQSLFIKGISLGGNMVLKYLGEGQDLPNELKGVVAVSVPCDLKGSSAELHKLKNRAYAMRFLEHLKKKLQIKLVQFPERLSQSDLNSIKTLIDFDHIYTSRAHGFKDAYDYYQKSSCRQFLREITVPTLIINSLNDSFLSPTCFPVKEAKNNGELFLEMPKHGGHVGFISSKRYFYDELRTLEFFNSL